MGLLKLISFVGVLVGVLVYSSLAQAAQPTIKWGGRTWTEYNGIGLRGQAFSAKHVAVGKRGNLNLTVAHGVGAGVSLPNENQLYGTWKVIYRMSRASGTKFCLLLWPGDSNRPEVDFSEDPKPDNGHRAETGATWHPDFVSTNEVHFLRPGNFTYWHEAKVVWTPGNLYFYDNGHLFGHVKDAPTKKMHLAIQARAWNHTGQPAVLQIRSVTIS